MTTVLTQKERLAALEAESAAHAREHELTERVWSAKLDAIDARLRGIERFLLDTPSHDPDVYEGWRLHRRDLMIISGSAGITSLIWLFVEIGLRLL
ncbi:MAG: hypothetical protein F4Z88_10355 [Chloroflexi bacterium]|nr:hypothetical protein [Chloroflexota bacterium]